MRRRLSVTCLLFAWFCATGALLDVAQMFAWSRMFAGYMRTLPAAQALSRTFDPEKPCEFCMAVQKAREAGRKQQPAPTDAAVPKIVLIRQQAGPLVVVPAVDAWPETNHMFASSWCPPVPVPPPRARVAIAMS